MEVIREVIGGLNSSLASNALVSLF